MDQDNTTRSRGTWRFARLRDVPAARRSATRWFRRGLVGAHRCAGVGQQRWVTAADDSCEIQACEGSQGFAAER